MYNCGVKIKELLFGTVEEVKNEAHSVDFYLELLINPLTDINNKAIQEYENFVEFNSSTFTNYRYKEEPVVDSEYYKRILGNRVD